MDINHNLKETASIVLQILPVKNGVTFISPNPINGWMQSMSNPG